MIDARFADFDYNAFKRRFKKAKRHFCQRYGRVTEYSLSNFRADLAKQLKRLEAKEFPWPWQAALEWEGRGWSDRPTEETTFRVLCFRAQSHYRSILERRLKAGEILMLEEMMFLLGNEFAVVFQEIVIEDLTQKARQHHLSLKDLLFRRGQTLNFVDIGSRRGGSERLMSMVVDIPAA